MFGNGFGEAYLFNLLWCFLAATQSVPRFIQEITDVYAREGESAVFECSYSGNPVPGILNSLVLCHFLITQVQRKLSEII